MFGTLMDVLSDSGSVMSGAVLNGSWLVIGLAKKKKKSG